MKQFRQSSSQGRDSAGSAGGNNSSMEMRRNNRNSSYDMDEPQIQGNSASG